MVAAIVLVAGGFVGESSALIRVATTASTTEAASGVIADDSMARAVASGWGAAAVGGSYSVASARGSSVQSGSGVFVIPSAGSSNSAILGSTRATDSVTRTTLTLPTIPTTGGGIYTSVVLRQSGRDSYRAKFRVIAGGDVRLSFSRVRNGVETNFGGERALGITLVADQALNIETEISGSGPVVLGSRAWLGSAVPADWQQTATDASDAKIGTPGATGLAAYLSGTSAAPATVRFGGLSARRPTVAVPVTATPSATPVTAPASSAATSAPASTAIPTPRPAVPPVSAAGEGNTGAATTPGGSAPVGSTTYPVPADAIVVSPSGDDGAAGTAAAPVRSVARAIALATTGRTVVLRGGVYHETVQIPANKKITLQSAPNEQAWLDGSTVVNGFTPSGSTWVKSGWTVAFDSTPCYNAGSCNNPDTAFQFVSPDAPMAAHPDQVWVNGQALRQVASVGQVTSGTFFVDEAGDKLVVGSDPTGKEVRASDLVDALAVRSAGSVVRGIGVRRYATPVPKVATVKADADDVLLENMVVSDNATTGVSATTRKNISLRNLTVDNNGMLGILGNNADGLSLSGVRASGNNTEKFKQSPVSGGIKITRSRRVSVAHGVFEKNNGPGTWFDESVYDITVTGNRVSGNAGHGVVLELCAKAVVANNLIQNNSREALKVNNTDGVQVWNNTFIGNNRTVWIVQDSRLASNLSTPGHDSRQTLPDPTMTWFAGSVTVSNNVFSHAAAGSPCVLCVEDATHKRSATQMNVVANGNVYNRSTPSTPASLVVWSAGPGNPQTFATVTAFAAATGQEKSSSSTDGARLTGDSGALTSAPPTGVAQPLPADVAGKIGVAAGSRGVGTLTG